LPVLVTADGELMVMSTGVVVRAQIEGAFYGFNRDVLFKLNDGTFWLQDEYRYWYHYAYRPQVEILRDGGRLLLRLAGSKEMVPVRQLSGVIESRLSGAFEGWHGESEYE
jgi:hypothetical protein